MFWRNYWKCVNQQNGGGEDELDLNDYTAPQRDMLDLYLPERKNMPLYNACRWSFVGALASIFENKVVYASPNSRSLVKTPKDYFMPNYEDIHIPTEDSNTIHAWLIKRREPRNFPTIIHFHGNACNISHVLYDALGMFQKVKANILLVDYRGYGLSEGNPSQTGLLFDAQAAMDYALHRKDVVDPNKIVLFGRSLGGAVAIALAAKNESKLAGIIVENTFTSMEDLVSHLSPILSRFRRLMKNKWRSEELIAKLRLPILFLSGRADEIVPAHMMTQLHAAAVKSVAKEMVSFPKGKHNSTCLSRGYYDAMKRFVDRILEE